MRIEEPGGQVAPAPDAKSFDQPLASLDEERQLGLEVDDVAVDDHGQPEDHRRHEQGQQSDRQSFAADPPRHAR